MPARSATTTEQDLLTVARGIPEPVGAPLHHLDLVGDAFSEGVRDAIVEVGQDRLDPPLKRAPGVGELRQISLDDVVDPDLEAEGCE